MMTSSSASRVVRTRQSSLQLQAQAELERRQRSRRGNKDEFEATRFDPRAYIINRLGWEPWAGDGRHPGQQEILDAYVLALRQQHERRDYEAGLKSAEQLEYWQPGQVILYRLRIEAGHTVGKTKLASGLVNHFF